MNKYAKAIMMIILFLSWMAPSGCFIPIPSDPPFYRYPGDHPDLYSVAKNTIFAIYDDFSSKVEVLEEDSCGRKLFFFTAKSSIAADTEGSGIANIGAFLIAQKNGNDYVYYYADDNFLLCKMRSGVAHKDLASPDEIKKLKERNDWDKPLDEAKCVKTKVLRYGKEYESKTPLISDEAIEQIERKLVPKDGPYTGSFAYFTSDDYGRHIYLYRNVIVSEGYSRIGYYDAYVLMFNKDGSFDPVNGIMEIKDLWNYQGDLKGFKERNGWNTP